MASHYNVPYIDLKEIIENGKKREDELGEEVRAYLEEKKRVYDVRGQRNLRKEKEPKKNLIYLRI